jgi:hypothetical protein
MTQEEKPFDLGAGIVFQDLDGKPVIGSANQNDEGDDNKQTEKKESNDLFAEVSFDDLAKAFKDNESGNEDSFNPATALAKLLADMEVVEAEDLSTVTNFTGLANLIKSNIETKSQRFKNNLPEDAKLFLEALETGKDVREAMLKVSDVKSIENIDITKEHNQEEVIRQALGFQDYTEEEIEDEIESLRKSGKLEVAAQRQHRFLVKNYKEQLQKQLEEEAKAKQLEESKRQQEAERAYMQLKNTVTTVKKLGALEVEDKDREKFLDYISKVNPKTGRTAYVEDIVKDEEAQLALAYYKFKGMTLPNKAEKRAETKVAQDLEKALSKKQIDFNKFI